MRNSNSSSSNEQQELLGGIRIRHGDYNRTLYYKDLLKPCSRQRTAPSSSDQLLRAGNDTPCVLRSSLSTVILSRCFAVSLSNLNSRKKGHIYFRMDSDPKALNPEIYTNPAGLLGEPRCSSLLRTLLQRFGHGDVTGPGIRLLVVFASECLFRAS